MTNACWWWVQPDKYNRTVEELEEAVQGLAELRHLRQVVLQVLPIAVVDAPWCCETTCAHIIERCEAVAQRLRRALPASTGLEVEYVGRVGGQW
jgi:hypothetical protein